MDMVSSFRDTLSRLRPEGKVLAAVSGGRDSMVMAYLLWKSGTPFSVIHCNFHLRGDESDRDERAVSSWCAGNGIEIHTVHFDTASYAQKNGVSIEMAARALRYSAFREKAIEGGFGCVAVAHNLNDNAETILLNLSRGTGIKGLAGIREDSFVPAPGQKKARLIRPMLGFSREEITSFAKENGIPWVDDSTNGQTIYRRNRIRHDVIPVLEELNPSVLEALSRTARNMQEAGAIVDDYVEEYASVVSRQGEDGTLLIDIPTLLSFPHWEYILHSLLEETHLSPDAFDDMKDRIRSFSYSKKGTATLSGLSFRGEKATAFLGSDIIEVIPNGLDAKGAPFSARVEGPGEFEGFSVAVINAPEKFTPPPPGQTAFDADKVHFPFTVRTWESGDYLHPMGMGGRKKKVSDALSDMKVPSHRKAREIVLERIPAEGGRVLSIIGKRVDTSAMVTPTTKRILLITLG